jgi:hypothetical protein
MRSSPRNVMMPLTSGCMRQSSTCCLQRLGESFYASLPFAHCLMVLGEGNALGRMLERDLSQVALMGRTPRGLAAVAAAVAQQQRFELLAHFEPGAHRIHARAAQVPDRLVAFVGDRDRHQLTRSRQARQHQRVASVSLDPIPGFAGDLRGRDYLTPIARRRKLPGQYVSTRTRLVHDQQRVPACRACPVPGSAPQALRLPCPRTAPQHDPPRQSLSPSTPRVHPIRQNP